MLTETEKTELANAVEQHIAKAREPEIAAAKAADVEAERIAKLPKPGSLDIVAAQHKANQLAGQPSGLFLKLVGVDPATVPAQVRNSEPAPVVEVDPNAPRPGSLEDVSSKWKANQARFGASTLITRR